MILRTKKIPMTIWPDPNTVRNRLGILSKLNYLYKRLLDSLTASIRRYSHHPPSNICISILPGETTRENWLDSLSIHDGASPADLIFVVRNWERQRWSRVLGRVAGVDTQRHRSREVRLGIDRTSGWRWKTVRGSGDAFFATSFVNRKKLWCQEA